MGKTAFVTGGNGFVGLNLVSALTAAGWQVRAMHRGQNQVQDLQDLGAETVQGDITDLRALRQMMPKAPDVVFHAAGNTSMWPRRAAEQTNTNVRGTRNVAKLALENGAGRLIHISSVMAYGLNTGTVTEDTPSRGASTQLNYARSKALAEREVRKAMRKGLNAVIINPGHMIGPYDQGNWSRLFKLVQQYRLPGMPPGGGTFCHAGEVSKALIMAAEKGVNGRNYMLGCVNTSYAGLVNEIAAVMGRDTRFRALNPSLLNAYARVEELIAPLFGREPEITRDAIRMLSVNMYCKSKRAEDELGYQPHTLRTMLSDCYGWLRDTGRI